MTNGTMLRSDKWATVAIRTGAIALIVYAVLWCVMWIPYLINGIGLMIFYPLFLLAWVPVELLALVSLVFAIIALSKRQGRRGGTIAILAANVVFIVTSLPMLLGSFPWLLFVPT
jgi:hypothetical protein